MLTAAQLQTLKTDILADPTLAASPNTSDGNFAIAAAYNLIVSPTFFVYRTDINPQEIDGQITWANLTPTDLPDGTTTWLNRSLACQGKQFNLQLMLQGQNPISAARANVRAGLQDALTNVPSGVGGATVSAGWNPVRDNVLARAATRAEKLFAAGGNGAAAATAATMAVEGRLTYSDIGDARNS